MQLFGLQRSSGDMASSCCDAKTKRNKYKKLVCTACQNVCEKGCHRAKNINEETTRTNERTQKASFQGTLGLYENVDAQRKNVHAIT